MSTICVYECVLLTVFYFGMILYTVCVMGLFSGMVTVSGVVGSTGGWEVPAK